MAELGANCSSSCATRDHLTWGACQRAKRQMIGYCRSHVGLDATKQKRWDNELAEYRSARAAGIQPDGTTTSKIRFAVDQSEKHGMRYGEEFRVSPRTDGKGYDALSHAAVKEVTDAVGSDDLKSIMDTAKGMI